MNSTEQRASVRVTGRHGGLVETVAAKLHGLRVTESRLDYHGSITIDSDIIEAARMLPLEFVRIWNKATGARIATYILPGPRGTGICCLNGAAARSCQVGDEVIVTSARLLPEEALCGDGARLAPRVLMFVHEPRVNTISETLEYAVDVRDGEMRFAVREVAGGGQDGSCRGRP